MSEDVTYLIAEEKWTALIGRFMLDFGSIEDSIYRVITFYNKEALNKDFIAFKVRLELFKAVMEERFVEVDLIKAFGSTVDEISGLYDIRNLIAHSSLSYEFKEDAEGNMNFIGFNISGRRKDDISVDFERLTNAVSKLKQCRTDLAKYMMQFHVAEFESTYHSSSVA